MFSSLGMVCGWGGGAVGLCSNDKPYPTLLAKQNVAICEK